MATGKEDGRRGAGVVQDPPIGGLVFSDTRFAWLWLIMRVYLAGSGSIPAGLSCRTMAGWTVAWPSKGSGNVRSGSEQSGPPLA